MAGVTKAETSIPEVIEWAPRHDPLVDRLDRIIALLETANGRGVKSAEEKGACCCQAARAEALAEEDPGIERNPDEGDGLEQDVRGSGAEPEPGGDRREVGGEDPLANQNREIRRIAKCFPVSAFIKEELDVRGWSVSDALDRMDFERYPRHLLGGLSKAHERALMWMVMVGEGELDSWSAGHLARVFGRGTDYWVNLDKFYRNCSNKKRIKDLERDGGVRKVAEIDRRDVFPGYNW